MSTSVIRFIEVKQKNIKGYINKKEDLDRIQNPTHKDTYAIRYPWMHKDLNPYYWYNSARDEWVGDNNCEYKWVLYKWYTPYDNFVEDEKPCISMIEGEPKDLKENFYFCNNGGAMRDTYYSKTYDHYGFAERGFPEDISTELDEYLKDEYKKFKEKNTLGDYDFRYNKSYVTLDELNNVLNKELKEYKDMIKKHIYKHNFNVFHDKLDFILDSMTKPILERKKYQPKKEGDNEDDNDDVYEEYNWDIEAEEEKETDIMTLSDEITTVMSIIDPNYASVPLKNIRIVFYFF